MRELHIMCKKCQTWLPSSKFWKNKSKRHGFDDICKNCYKSYRSYAKRLERSRNGYRPPSARNEVRREKERLKREMANA